MVIVESPASYFIRLPSASWLLPLQRTEPQRGGNAWDQRRQNLLSWTLGKCLFLFSHSFFFFNINFISVSLFFQSPDTSVHVYVQPQTGYELYTNFYSLLFTWIILWLLSILLFKKFLLGYNWFTKCCFSFRCTKTTYYLLFVRFLFQIGHYRIGQMSLCYTVVLYQFSILYIVVCMYQSQSSNLSLLPSTQPPTLLPAPLPHQVISLVSSGIIPFLV